MAKLWIILEDNFSIEINSNRIRCNNEDVQLLDYNKHSYAAIELIISLLWIFRCNLSWYPTNHLQFSVITYCDLLTFQVYSEAWLWSQPILLDCSKEYIHQLWISQWFGSLGKVSCTLSCYEAGRISLRRFTVCIYVVPVPDILTSSIASGENRLPKYRVWSDVTHQLEAIVLLLE